MQKEVGDISDESTQDKYIYTHKHTIIYLHIRIKTLKTSHCPHKTVLDMLQIFTLTSKRADYNVQNKA